MSQLTPLSRARARVLALLAVALAALIVVACSAGTSFTARSDAATPTKTRRPTFTPLPGALTPAAGPVVRGTLPPGVAVEATTVPESALGTPGASVAGDTNLVIYATDTPTPSPTPTQRRPTATPIENVRAAAGERQPTPYVVVKPATLNGRRGPGAGYDRIGQAKQGQQMFILGRTADNSWYQVCCLANQPVWLPADQVDVQNQANAAPVMTPAPTPIPVPPTAKPPVVARGPRTGQSPVATPRPIGTPLPPFDIARGPEFPIKRDDGRMTIWANVHEGPPDNELPLGGYILKVFRDGVDISDNQVSFNDHPFYSTKPEGDYKYNLKFEKYDAGEADWEIYLARPGGFRVSPVTKFTTKGDSYRNLVVYIAYLLAR